jgi:hypothetical protein
MRPLREIGGATTVPSVAGISPELHLLLKVLTIKEDNIKQKLGMNMWIEFNRFRR